ncbi:MAG: heme-binding protein, partial [Propionibacteriales bacterium]|nr:heme-binding protein [Propionibacteriales bacterium]
MTLEQAEAVIEACKAEAEAVGQPMNIAVVDDGANLVAFTSMDDTKL